MNNIENAIKEIEELLKEAEQNCEGAAAGFDEGFYSGECNAYSNVLNILNKRDDKMNNLYGFINLKCPVCNKEHLYYVGRNITDEQFKDEFTESERTCDTCNKYIFDSIIPAIDCINWNTDYIVESLSGELENQNKHSQTSYPEYLYEVLKVAGMTDKNIINQILLNYFATMLIKEV